MNLSRCTRNMFLIAGLAALTAAGAPAQTAPTTLFQLDGNAAQTLNNGNPINCMYAVGVNSTCDYWNLLNGTGNNLPGGGIGNNSSAGSSSVRTFINGLSSTDSFTGGGSKDSNLISQWAYSASPTPNKDTLNAGYAAAYTAPLTGDFEVIFGADRASPNGDANIGIWFFQQSVGPNGSGGFTGAHVNHDIFVISSFTGGGGTSTISVFEWDNTCASGVKNPTSGQCSDTNLRLLGSSSQVCTSTSIYCAITNSAPTMTSWEGTLASPLFFEGGVDITAALASVGVTQLPCFSSFLEETRSSQSTTAVLKDFVAGGFPVCGLHITKSCDANNTMLVNNGTQVQFGWIGTVTNTGIGTLSSVQVNDTLPDGTTQHPALSIGGVTVTSIPPKQTANYSITYTAATTAATNKATAQGNFGSQVFNSDNTAQASCSQPVNSTLTITKSCVLPGLNGLSCGAGGCVVQVPFSAHVCNTGTVQVTGVTLADNPSTASGGAITPNSLTLNPGQCTGGTGNPADPTGLYQPTSFDISSNGVSNGRFLFDDTISITSASAALGATLNKVTTGLCSGTYGCASAQCPLCAGGECAQ